MCLVILEYWNIGDITPKPRGIWLLKIEKMQINLAFWININLKYIIISDTWQLLIKAPKAGIRLRVLQFKGSVLEA